MIRRILFFVSEDWYFYSHRIALACAARDAGYEVIVVTHVSEHGGLIEKEGFRLLSLDINRSALNPLGDARVISRLVSAFRRYRPTIVHNVALKPVLCGVIAARLAGVPCVVNTLPGMGHLFSKHDNGSHAFLTPIVRSVMRRLLQYDRSRVIVQNQFDYKAMQNEMRLQPSSISLIRGSGVDIEEFSPTPEPDGVVRITLVSRMIWDKGIGELVAAGTILKERGVRCLVTLVGSPDERNPRAISDLQLREWVKAGAVEWWGRRNDIPTVWAQSHIACLPTYYREGLPKSLLEAAACGRPIITSDMPGCLELVEDGQNGIVVPPKDPRRLADAIEKLVNNPELRKRMGADGRQRVEKSFSQEIIVGQTLDLYEELLGRFAS